MFWHLQDNDGAAVDYQVLFNYDDDPTTIVFKFSEASEDDYVIERGDDAIYDWLESGEEVAF